MKTASAKNKGRLLQKWVVSELLKVFQDLTQNDLRSTSMGAGGEDVQRSEIARTRIPYQFECKNRQTYKGIYDTYDQAALHGDDIPVVVLKMNRKKPLVVIDAQHFFELIARVQNAAQ